MSEIDNLIAAANREHKSRKSQTDHRKARNDSMPFREAHKLLWVAAVVILAAAIVSFVFPFLPISEDIIRSDLNTALDAAQSSVEAYRRDNGRLPGRVPDAALAGLVQYEPVDDGYRLSISMNGVTLSREP